MSQRSGPKVRAKLFHEAVPIHCEDCHGLAVRTRCCVSCCLHFTLGLGLSPRANDFRHLALGWKLCIVRRVDAKGLGTLLQLFFVLCQICQERAAVISFSLMASMTASLTFNERSSDSNAGSIFSADVISSCEKVSFETNFPAIIPTT